MYACRARVKLCSANFCTKPILAALLSSKSIFSRRNAVCAIWKPKKEYFMKARSGSLKGSRLGVILY